jgi:hypothetical protein
MGAASALGRDASILSPPSQAFGGTRLARPRCRCGHCCFPRGKRASARVRAARLEVVDTRKRCRPRASLVRAYAAPTHDVRRLRRSELRRGSRLRVDGECADQRGVWAPPDDSSAAPVQICPRWRRRRPVGSEPGSVRETGRQSVGRWSGGRRFAAGSRAQASGRPAGSGLATGRRFGVRLLGAHGRAVGRPVGTVAPAGTATHHADTLQLCERHAHGRATEGRSRSRSRRGASDREARAPNSTRSEVGAAQVRRRHPGGRRSVSWPNTSPEGGRGRDVALCPSPRRLSAREHRRRARRRRRGKAWNRSFAAARGRRELRAVGERPAGPLGVVNLCLGAQSRRLVTRVEASYPGTGTVRTVNWTPDAKAAPNASESGLSAGIEPPPLAGKTEKWRGPEPNRGHHDSQAVAGRALRRRNRIGMRSTQGPTLGRYPQMPADVRGFWTLRASGVQNPRGRRHRAETPTL